MSYTDRQQLMMILERGRARFAMDGGSIMVLCGGEGQLVFAFTDDDDSEDCPDIKGFVEGQLSDTRWEYDPKTEAERNDQFHKAADLRRQIRRVENALELAGFTCTSDAASDRVRHLGELYKTARDELGETNKVCAGLQETEASLCGLYVCSPEKLLKHTKDLLDQVEQHRSRESPMCHLLGCIPENMVEALFDKDKEYYAGHESKLEQTKGWQQSIEECEGLRGELAQARGQRAPGVEAMMRTLADMPEGSFPECFKEVELLLQSRADKIVELTSQLETRTEERETWAKAHEVQARELATAEGRIGTLEAAVQRMRDWRAGLAAAADRLPLVNDKKGLVEAIKSQAGLAKRLTAMREQVSSKGHSWPAMSGQFAFYDAMIETLSVEGTWTSEDVGGYQDVIDRAEALRRHSVGLVS